jgi:hypothetical protein
MALSGSRENTVMLAGQPEFLSVGPSQIGYPLSIDFEYFHACIIH